MKLTAEQKCDIAQRELEELRDEIEKLKDESEKILDNFRVGQQIVLIKLKENFDKQALYSTYHKVRLMFLHFCHCKAVMEEADIRSAEVKKSSYEFERDIVKGAVNQVLLYKIKFFISLKKHHSCLFPRWIIIRLYSFTCHYFFADFAENQ